MVTKSSNGRFPSMTDLRHELDPPFEIIEPPATKGPVLFNSPHSGSTYPRAFLAASRLDVATLRRSEDSFVDALIAGVVKHGFPLMRAHFPRCFVDVNREPYELDPRMFDGRLPSFANTRSMRVAGGLGTVARVVGDAQEIYDQRIPVDDALQRIDTLYKPYHRALRRLFSKCTVISARQCSWIVTRCRHPRAIKTSVRGLNSYSATATEQVVSAWWRKLWNGRCARWAIP